MDIKGFFGKKFIKNGNCYVLVVVDLFICVVEMIFIFDKLVKIVVSVFIWDVFCWCGIFELILIDCGCEFDN